jgi:hypothetical protein
MMESGFPGAIITLIFVFQVIFILGLMAGFIFSVVALWRISRAHRDLADSLKEMAGSMRKEASNSPDNQIT